jgi:hypothetical protein
VKEKTSDHLALVNQAAGRTVDALRIWLPPIRQCSVNSTRLIGCRPRASSTRRTSAVSAAGVIGF